MRARALLSRKRANHRAYVRVSRISMDIGILSDTNLQEFSTSGRSESKRHGENMPADFLPGNYRCIPGGSRFAGGVGAWPGHEIRRARSREPVPLARGFE